MCNEQFKNNLLNMYYQLYDFCEHDGSTLQADCVLYTMYEEDENHDHKMCTDKYSVKGRFYVENIIMLYNQQSDVMIREIHRCLKPISGRNCNNIRSTKPFWNKELMGPM